MEEQKFSTVDYKMQRRKCILDDSKREIVYCWKKKKIWQICTYLFLHLDSPPGLPPPRYATCVLLHVDLFLQQWSMHRHPSMDAR